MREFILQVTSLDATHEAGDKPRPTVDDLLEIYRIDETQTEPTPKSLAIFDDVLTAGVHYRAMHTILRRRFPGVRIVGFFVARRVFPNPSEAAASE